MAPLHFSRGIPNCKRTGTLQNCAHAFLLAVLTVKTSFLFLFSSGMAWDGMTSGMAWHPACIRDGIRHGMASGMHMGWVEAKRKTGDDTVSKLSPHIQNDRPIRLPPAFIHRINRYA